MPSNIMTKRIFADALKKLMRTKSFAKISVGDIAKACDMNRNSFYYHFKDKYELLNWIFFTEITEHLNREKALELPTWDILEYLTRFFYQEKEFYANAMNYEGQDSLIRNFTDLLRTLFEARTRDLFKDDLDEEFRQFYMDFFLDAVVRAVVRWVRGGAKYPPEEFVRMMRKAATGTALRILEYDGEAT